MKKLKSDFDVLYHVFGYSPGGLSYDGFCYALKANVPAFWHDVRTKEIEAIGLPSGNKFKLVDQYPPRNNALVA